MSDLITGAAMNVCVQHHARRSRRGGALALLLLALGGCDHVDIRDAAGYLPPYQRAVDRPKTVLDRALDICPDKTEERETGCVRQALIGAKIDVPALVALLPGCRQGVVCHYGYTTDDRMGYVPAIAAEFVVHWRVDVDLRHASRTVAEVPVTVEQVEQVE